MFSFIAYFFISVKYINGTLNKHNKGPRFWNLNNISIHLLVFYHECHYLIGYASYYDNDNLFYDR